METIRGLPGERTGTSFTGLISDPMNNNPGLFWATLLIIALNLAAITCLSYRIVETGSDKGTVLFVFYYPLLLAANAFGWFLLKVFDNPLVRPMKYIVIALLVVMIPLGIVLSFS